MSVLIEDMDLPKTCYECMFRDGEGRKKLSCSITAMVCDLNGERPAWCPMREYKPVEKATVVPQRVEFRWKT